MPEIVARGGGERGGADGERARNEAVGEGSLEKG